MTFTKESGKGNRKAKEMTQRKKKRECLETKSRY